MGKRQLTTLVACATALLAFVPTAPAQTEAAPEVYPAPPKSFPAAGEIIWPSVGVRAKPSTSAKRIAIFTQFRPDYRLRVVLAVARRKAEGRLWYKVHVPGRPNGRMGWLRADAAELVPVAERIVIDRSERKLELRRNGKVLLRTTVGVGKPGRETPLGNFYITAKFRPTLPILGAYAMETSAYSKVTDWPGGGIVGIHGTPWPELLGQAVSSGCIRVQNAHILKLKRLAPLGTPIRIVS